MNKYQYYILNDLFNFILWHEESSESIRAEINDVSLILKQFDDVTITCYSLIIEVKDTDCLDSLLIEYYLNDVWHPVKLYKGNMLKTSIDFNNQIKKLRISSPKNIFDEFELDINYVFADKDLYYEKKKLAEEAAMIARQKEINQLINPEHKTGTDLVNIFWNLVSDKIHTVKINLYSNINGKERLVESFNESTVTFKSVKGLAFGEYFYEIIEYDASMNEIARSEKNKFTLCRPYYGKPVVSNR